jgi:diaminopimelate decarboxylase
MHYFHYEDNELYCEDVSVTRICSDLGTPVYIYSRATLARHFSVFQQSFTGTDHLVCFSMKACSNIAILSIFRKLGGGVDIVSGGELYRALKAGIDPGKIVYSGVGKTAPEIDQALAAGILMFNVESDEELLLLNARAVDAGKKAKVAIRVNPDVDPRTHPYISTGLKKNKFGIDVSASIELYRRAKKMDGIDPVGLDCHIGSQLTELSPFLEAVERLRDLINTLRTEGISIKFLDIGGGLGINYDQEEPPLPEAYGSAIIEKVSDMGVKLILEPGRVLVGNAGILVTKVLYQKRGPVKRFIIVDAAMNDLIRPSLYDAHHAVWKVNNKSEGQEKIVVDLVGPICESGDFLAQGREIDPLKSGEYLALMSAGAYGFSMSSNYNSRPRAAEVLVDGDRYYTIRDRETYEDLTRRERIPEELS